MASVCKCFNWTPEYVMHGVSYPALMLIVDGLPDTSGKEKKKTHRNPDIALAQAGIKLMEG